MDYHNEKDYNVISYKLPLFSAIFLIIIVIGFFTLRRPSIDYAMNIEESWKEAVNDKSALRPERVYEILHTADTAYYQFIDIRTPAEFLTNHIEGAINIPVHQILDDEVKSIFRQDKKINVIYGNTHVEACAPVMLLKQIGYENNIVMLGGFSHFKDYVLKTYMPNASNYLDEKPEMDFKAIMSSVGSSGGEKSESTNSTVETPIKKKKVAGSAGGGC